jgi:hypothetical protein
MLSPDVRKMMEIVQEEGLPLLRYNINLEEESWNLEVISG